MKIQTTLRKMFTHLTRLVSLTLVLSICCTPEITACEIFEVVVEKGECTSDSTYTLWVNFEYVDVGGDHFDLWANGTFFGSYAYADLPLTITNFPKSGNNNDWIKICDNDNPGCCRIKEFPTKDCSNFNNCEIFEVNVDKGDCTSDSTYEVWINFEYANVESDYFDLWLNGVFYDEFLYTSLPLYIANFPKSGNNNDWIKICDHDNPDCCKIHEFESKNCANYNDCEIWDLIVEPYECEDGQFMVDLDFNFANVGNNGFTVQGNGVNYGTFDYNDLYITFGPLEGDCMTNYEFVVKDVDNPDCQAVFILGEVCCSEDCHIYDLVVEKGDCTSDSTYSLTINFQYQNVNGASFDLFANGQFFGYYNYNQLPLTINNFPKSGGNYDWVKVCDNDNPDCCAIKEFPTKECGNNGDCSIKELDVLVSDCNEDDQFFVTINFIAMNPGGQGFSIFGNGMNYGVFSYDSLPVILGPLPGNCTTEYEFVIKDNEFNDCQKAKEVGKVCCSDECHIDGLVVEKGDCTSDSTYVITINFQFQNVNGSSFDLFANGQFFGYYNYNQLPLTIANFPKSGGNNDWIKVCDNDNPDCCAVKEFPTKECGNFNDCSIKELDVIVGDCNDDDQFLVTIDFIVMNPGSQGFSILGNGMNYGSFSYDSLPVVLGPLPGNCITEYEFVIKDNEFNDCKKVKELGKVCCEEPCEIYELEVEVGGCLSDSTYEVTINFQVQNPGNDFFEVWTNGDYYGYFPLSDLPLTIEFMAGGYNIDEIKVCINDQPNCCKEIEFAPPSCLQIPIYYLSASNSQKAGSDPTLNNTFRKDTGADSSAPDFQVTVYPGQQRLLVRSAEQAMIRQVHVVDAIGRLVGRHNSSSDLQYGTIEIPISAVQGIVFVQVTFVDGRVVRKVFIP